MYLEALVTEFVLYLELTIVKYNDKKNHLYNSTTET